MFTLPIRWAEGADRSLPLPSYETAGSAGVDLRANFAQAQRAVGGAGEGEADWMERKI